MCPPGKGGRSQVPPQVHGDQPAVARRGCDVGQVGLEAGSVSEPLLGGRRLISLTASGSENAWFVESGGWDAIRASFDHRLAGATGLKVLDHVNYGGVDADLDPALVEKAVQGVRDVVAALDQGSWSAP